MFPETLTRYACVVDRRYSVLNHELDFRQIVLRISLEDHARPFEIDLAAGSDEHVAFLLGVSEHFLVGAAKLLVRALVKQSEAAAGGKVADFDAIARLPTLDGHAG